MRNPDFCICENKDADQLRGNREADQRLCFRYSDSMILLLSKSKISRLQPSSAVVQPGLCWTGRISRSLVFSERGLIVLFCKKNKKKKEVVGIQYSLSLCIFFAV